MAAFSFSDGLLTTLERVGVLNPPLESVYSESEQDDNEGEEGTPLVEAFFGVAKKNSFEVNNCEVFMRHFLRFLPDRGGMEGGGIMGRGDSVIELLKMEELL